MKLARKIGVAVLLFLFSKTVSSQQLKLGNNPSIVEKSAVLELLSDNQGLLLPRITDTSLINVLLPPDGMVIFFSPTKQILIRSNGYWQGLAIAGSGVTSLNGNTGALTLDTTYINNFYLKVRGLHSGIAPITYDSITGAIGITKASSTTNGYLDSTSWTSFNNRVKKAGDTMTGYLVLNANPVTALGAATKAYVDNMASGITYVDAILTPDLINDNLNTPPVALDHESYIIGASPTGAWSGLAGHVVFWNGSSWTDVLSRPVQAGDRFGVLLHDSTFTASGGLTGKKYDIVQVVNATPGSITYSVTIPTLGMTVFDAGAPADGDYGDGYNFNGTYWNEFISSISYVPGSGLTLTGNVLSIGPGQVTNSMLAGSITASKLVGTDIATVGTITSGIWNGTPITDPYISSAANWNAKLSSVSNLAGTGVPVYKNTVANNANFKRLIAGPGMTITEY